MALLEDCRIALIFSPGISPLPVAKPVWAYTQTKTVRQMNEEIVRGGNSTKSVSHMS
jgi:hypothetical protein